MTTSYHQAWSTSPFIRYLCTAAVLCCPLYVDIATTLDFAASRPDLPFSLASFWPLLLLVIPIGLLVTSALISQKQPRTAGRTAFIATILAWLYYALMLCPFLFALALFLFASPIKALAFFLPCILLAFTTTYARHASRSGNV